MQDLFDFQKIIIIIIIITRESSKIDQITCHDIKYMIINECPKYEICGRKASFHNYFFYKYQPAPMF